MSQRKRAAIWVRVSTQSQDDAYGPESQLRECRSLCAQNDWEVVAEYRVVFSAEWLEDIPQWESIKAAIRRRDFDVLVTLGLDRMCRDPWDTGTVLRACRHYDVKIVPILDEIPEGEYGDLFLFMKGSGNSTERKKINIRTSLGRKAKMQGDPDRGIDPRPLGSQWVPYGLRWADETETKGGTTRLTKKRFEPDPDTIKVLRSIFRWYDEGCSLRSITKRLMDAGVKPPGFGHRGSVTWHAMTLRRILANENYIGIGYANTRDCREKRGGNWRPREEWIPLPEGTFPKVVDEALFARMQERLQRNKTECAPGNRNPELGLLRRGIGVCGYCGRSLNIAINHGRPYYRCAPENRDRYGCGLFSMSVTRLDEEVWIFVRNLFQRPGALEAKLFGDPAPDPTGVTLPLARTEVARLLKERDRVHRRLRQTDDDVLATSYENELKSVLAEVRAAEVRCHALEAEHEAWRIAHEQRASVLNEAAQLRDELDGLDYHGRRNILLRIRAKIELFSEKDADPRWSVTTGFVVGRFYSHASNQPLVPIPFGSSAPLTIVFGDEEPSEAIAVEDMTAEERAQQAEDEAWWASNLYHPSTRAPNR
jgi:DNA invertase Pin-like site-specific DNA recombinase